EEAQEELDVVQGNITAEEVQIAIKLLKSNKAAGLDQIQAEFLKYGGPIVVAKLTDLFNACWRMQAVPEDYFDMRKAMVRPNAGIDWDGQNRLTDLDFVDDIALLAENSYHLQEITSSLHEEAAKVGLHISAEKSKVMHMGAQADMPSIKVDGSDIEEVSRFTYLGSTIGQDGDATSVFQQMCKTCSSASILLSIKLRLYTTIILPMATYAAETQVSLQKHEHLFQVSHTCL
uniref:Reverse transcriptase domain-containing protein n=1 Tax=Sinocyclocheilus grahami TaxID=75366 RepID=A0A672N5B5_SINGR